MYKSFFKQLIDFIIAFVALTILLPLFLVVALAIKVESKGPAFFVQKRLGQFGKEFSIYKFRSMVVHSASSTLELYEDDPRITRVGRIIRKMSIDEIPQLLNIIKGQMSFIGPRPPVTYFPKKINEYNEFESQRFQVKPGISGLAQIKQREIHDWDLNIPLDVEYVQNFSFVYDLRLFIASLKTFFVSENIYRKQSVK